MSLNPAELGYYEKRAGSGVWSKPSDRNTYRVNTCQRCGTQYLGRNDSRYCSLQCVHRGALLTDDPSYAARHHRVYVARGSASQYKCADCGEPAEHWAHIHDAPDTDPMSYRPLCRRCHKFYDHETVVRGERVGNSKLSASNVRAIRAAEISSDQLAKTFAVSRAAINHIKAGRTWRHVQLGR